MPQSVWVAIEKVMQQAIWFMLFLVLARILGPKPYGQFAIVMVFIQFCELVIVEATVEAMIGVVPLRVKHVMTANLVCLSISIAIGVALFICATSISNGFGDPELAPIFKALSILPAMSALTAAPIAMLRSELRFKVLTIRSTAGLAFGGGCGVLLALSGAGIWALVIQAITQKLAEIAILISQTGRFRLGWSRRHFEELRHFAAPVFFSRGLGFAGAQLPRLVLGLFLGPYEVGLYIFAVRLPDMVAVLALVPTTMVARSALREHANNPIALEEAFRKLLRDTALIAFPICTGAIATMPLFISAFLDARWSPAIFPAQVLVIAPMAWLINYASTALLLATRQPHAEVKISMVQTLSTALILGIAPFGLAVLCLVSTIRYILLVPVPISIVKKKCGIEPAVFVKALAMPFLASIFMGLVVSLANAFVAYRLPFAAALLLLVTLGVVLYGLLVGLSERNRAFEMMRRLRAAGSMSA